MKLRVRTRGRTVAIDIPQNASLSDLAASVRKTTNGGLVGSTEGFRLSLNGKAPLSQDGNTKLSDLGIVAGDLVHILMDPAGHNNSSSTKHHNNPFLHSPTTQRLETAKPSTETSFHSSQQPKSTNEETTQHSENENQTKPSHQQSNMALLSTLYTSSQVTTLNEAIFVALHSFMLECGFHCNSSSPRSSMPDGWKQHGVHKVVYEHPVALAMPCSLVCISLGPCVVVHGSVDSTGQDSNKMQIKPSDFIRGDVPLTAGVGDVYHNFSSLSEQFKLSIAYQLIDGIKRELGLTDQVSLLALAPETKLHILGFLDVKSLLCCSRVCQELRVLTDDKRLWRGLFKASFESTGYDKSTTTDWKAEFKVAYIQRREVQQASGRPKRGISNQCYYKFCPQLPLRPQPCYPFPPGIVGGEHDRRPFPQFPIQPSPFSIPSPGSRDHPFHESVPPPRPRFDPYGPLPEHRYDFGSRWNRRGPGMGGWGGNAFL